MGFKTNKKKFRSNIKPLEVVSADDPKKLMTPKDPTILPNTFKFAAESLKTMNERGGSVGSIVVSKYKSYNYKLIYALVMNAVKNIKLIKKIIHNLKLMNSIKENNPFLVEIMVGDLLFGQGLKSIDKNPIAVAIKDHKDAIVKEHAVLKKEFSDETEEEIAKYLRVNHIKCDIQHVISKLKSAGLNQLEYSKEKIKFKKFISKYKAMDGNQFMLDFHFPNDLIIMKPSTAKKLNKTELLRTNKATFQDKTSFMAVEALDSKPSQYIIDGCFAPGCKTSLIAAKMKNKGKILAYDKNKHRLVSAIRFLKLQGATNVQYECSDFSTVKLRRLPKIHKIKSFDSILIDPSCSGSGIQSRLDYKRTNEEIGRLKKLQAFQVALLKHALKACVSNVIVYCTCSTSVEENEQVVEMALNESGVKDKWQLVDIVPYWPQRGDSSFDFGQKCVRSNSDCLTNGFFIAKFHLNEEDTDEFKEQQSKTKKFRLEQAEHSDEEDDDASNEDNDNDSDDEVSDESESDDEDEDHEYEDAIDAND